MSNEIEIIVAGDPEESYTCITSDTRPFRWHAWLRAIGHIHRMKGVNFFERTEAARICEKVADICQKTMKPPKRVVPAFGWGKPIHHGDKPCPIKGIS